VISALEIHLAPKHDCGCLAMIPKEAEQIIHTNFVVIIEGAMARGRKKGRERGRGGSAGINNVPDQMSLKLPFKSRSDN